VPEGLGVSADEEDAVHPAQLVPGQPAVAPARAQLLAEDGDRPLTRVVDVGEGPARRLRVRDRPHLDAEA
jgi:hypothetical protein